MAKTLKDRRTPRTKTMYLKVCPGVYHHWVGTAGRLSKGLPKTQVGWLLVDTGWLIVGWYGLVDWLVAG